jgi:hypothetical protein
VRALPKQIRHSKSPQKIATYKESKQGEGNYTHLLNNRVYYTNYLTPLFNKPLTIFSSLEKRRVSAYAGIPVFNIIKTA